MSLLKHKVWPLAGTLGILTAACIVLLVSLPDRMVAAAPPSKKSAPAAKAAESDRPAAASDSEDAGDLPENPFPRRFKAPELDGGTGWLNTSGEISMKDLRGKVVLLDFWTFCC